MGEQLGLVSSPRIFADWTGIEPLTFRSVDDLRYLLRYSRPNTARTHEYKSFYTIPFYQLKAYVHASISNTY